MDDLESALSPIKPSVRLVQIKERASCGSCSRVIAVVTGATMTTNTAVIVTLVARGRATTGGRMALRRSTKRSRGANGSIARHLMCMKGQPQVQEREGAHFIYKKKDLYWYCDCGGLMIVCVQREKGKEDQ